MLEGGRGGEPRRRARLAHELPGVQRVEQVDVRGPAVQHLDRERAARRGLGAREALVGIAAVLELHRREVSPTRGPAA